MKLSLDSLAAFIAVADEGHFGRAAERLSMTQPPLSRRIQGLESLTGTLLFERTAQGATLTPAGEALQVEARRLLAQTEALPDLVRRVDDGRAGRIALGFTASSSMGPLGPLLAEAEEVLPGVEIVLQEQVTSLKLEGLRAGRLDLGLLRHRIPPPDLDSRVIHRERLVLAVPAAHALAGSEAAVEPSDLSGLAMITYDPEQAAYFAQLVTAVLRGSRPRSAQRVAQIHSMMGLVQAGRGVAIVPESISSLTGDEVVFRPISGWDAAVVELRIAWRRDLAHPAARRALDVLDALSEASARP